MLLHMFLDWPLLHDPLFQFFCSLPVYVLGFFVFGRSAYHSLKNGVPNMDVLIFTGAFAAFVYSITGSILYFGTHQVHQYLFYETGTTIISLVLLGNLIEKRSVRQTASEMIALQQLRPAKARKIEQHNGHEHLVDVTFEQIEIGDLLQVNEGDRIPMDGKIISGDCMADESLITGESTPVFRKANDVVIGGAMAMQGSFKMQTSANSKNAILTAIIETVKKAQADKPPVQKLADQVSAIFVPVVIGIAVISFFINFLVFDIVFSQSMMRSIAVLVISCPCAMGLATPTAVMVGIGKAARNGILITKASALEMFALSKSILFDKTGTLTDGKFQFEIEVFENNNEDECKNLMFQLEKHSSHPIAKSITDLKHWNKALILFDHVEEQKGRGVTASFESKQYFFGSPDATNIGNDADLILTMNKQPMAALRIRDQLKVGVNETLEYFSHAGLQTILVSGDKQAKCDALAQQVKLDQIYAGQKPQQKIDLVDERASNGLVTMVGDGINDAPALSKATVAVTFGNATAIAQQSAQIILLRSGFTVLRTAHIIAKQTYRVIKQNLFWAFAYNIVAIPLAAAGYMHPMLAAASMAFSDVVVIGNAVRLRFTKIKF